MPTNNTETPRFVVVIGSVSVILFMYTLFALYLLFSSSIIEKDKMTASVSEDQVIQNEQ